MFGRAKFQAGVLIFPAPHHIFDTEELEKKKAYIELIWYVIFLTRSFTWFYIHDSIKASYSYFQ